MAWFIAAPISFSFSPRNGLAISCASAVTSASNESTKPTNCETIDDLLKPVDTHESFISRIKPRAPQRNNPESTLPNT